MGLGLVIGAVSAGIQIAGAVKQAKGFKQIAAAQVAETGALKQAESARQTQMNLEASRRRRDIIRQSILARSQALFAANGQGAAQGSGLQGGYGQISGQSGNAIVGENQNQEIGNTIFAANQSYYDASTGIARGQEQVALGQGISSIGGALISNLGQITRLGNYATRNAYA